MVKKSTIREFNFEGLKFCGQPSHKELMSSHFQGSVENMNSCYHAYIFMNSKQPQIPQKFEPLKIKYSYDTQIKNLDVVINPDQPSLILSSC